MAGVTVHVSASTRWAVSNVTIAHLGLSMMAAKTATVGRVFASMLFRQRDVRFVLTRICTRFVWLDVNECAKDNGGCDTKRKCVNSAGGYTCGDCSSGYTNDGAKDCKGLCRLS